MQNPTYKVLPPWLAKLVQITPIKLGFMVDIPILHGGYTLTYNWGGAPPSRCWWTRHLPRLSGVGLGLHTGWAHIGHQRRHGGILCGTDLGIDDIFNDHFRNRLIGGTYHIKGLAYFSGLRETTISGWWLSLPLCKIWVSWDDDIPNWMEKNNPHVPNQLMIFPGCKNWGYKIWWVKSLLIWWTPT